ncbi:MAG: AbrB/MazE/SpoVT family DNA-binding domain-containing protein [Anaerolineae bacterium]
MSSKGQVIIPKDIRQELGLSPKTRLRIGVVDGIITLEPAKLSAIDALYGMCQGSDLLSDLEEEHRREIEADEAALRP